MGMLMIATCEMADDILGLAWTGDNDSWSGYTFKGLFSPKDGVQWAHILTFARRFIPLHTDINIGAAIFWEWSLLA